MIDVVLLTIGYLLTNVAEYCDVDKAIKLTRKICFNGLVHTRVLTRHLVASSNRLSKEGKFI